MIFLTCYDSAHQSQLAQDIISAILDHLYHVKSNQQVLSWSMIISKNMLKLTINIFTP